jgi:hypothetical protein
LPPKDIIAQGPDDGPNEPLETGMSLLSSQVMKGVTDDYGLTLPNQFINLYIPATNRCIPLYCKFRHNPNYSLINYGPLPFTNSSSFSNYNGLAGGTGGSSTPAGNGQMPASAWIKGVNFPSQASLSSVSFNVSGTFPYGTSDIWYSQNANRIFEVYQAVWPRWTRVGIDIPVGQTQQSLQDTVTGGVDQDFGWNRGRAFAAHVPWIHYGYGYGNDTNLPVYTKVFFRYAEQEVSLVTNPQLIFEIVNNKRPNHFIQMPIVQSQATIAQALQQTWGFPTQTPGYPVFPDTPGGRLSALGGVSNGKTVVGAYAAINSTLSVNQGVAQ